MIPQIFIPTAELVIPTGTETNEENAKIEAQPLTVKAKISKCSSSVFLIFFKWIPKEIMSINNETQCVSLLFWSSRFMAFAPSFILSSLNLGS